MMDRLPDASWRHRAGMDRLLAALDADAGATRFVGGCVRDALLGLEQKDIDLATRFTPQEVIARLEKARIKAVPTGIAHGTVTAIASGTPVEVTTLRRDVSTTGRHATVAFTDDWEEDAARRDFTINALSADPASGAVFDYFGGLADLEVRRVRFIGDPLQRIAEDHLRILRFFRFHARFGAEAPDTDGIEACAARANDLMALSRERIADELLKLLALPAPAGTLRLMIARGILRPVLPEIESADRLDALVAAEQAAGVEPNPIRRLAALLPADPKIAADIAMRLRLSNRQGKRLAAAAGTEVSEPIEALAYRLGAAEAIDRILLHGNPGSDLKTLETWHKPRLPVSGGDLIAMGLSAGPQVAAALQANEREWIAAGFPDDRDAVRAMARRHVAQALRSSQ
jgi:poly(A) polymerase